MTLLDYSIIIIYLLIIVLIGLYFEKKASKGIDSYFLGDKKLPWWALGASGMASNLDVSGTMINTAFIYSLGAVGFFIEIRGGIVLTMAFFMIFMGKWNRRASVMTLAEWMELRFGSNLEGRVARLIAAIGIILSTIAIISYFAVGGGKFISEILDVPSIFGFSPEFTASVLMIFLAMVYTVASGLQGVVWTDVFQGVLIMLTIVIVCFIAITQFVLPQEFVVSVPMLNGEYTQIEKTQDVWTSILPNWNLDLPEGSSYSIYNLFGLVIIFYLMKTFIEGSGGTGGYMVQRFFAARSDREAGLLSLFWIFLLSFRWPFIVAIAMMAIAYGAASGNVIQDPEMVLPVVIHKLLPMGLKGLLIAGLIAAAMSTFDSLVNSGASYWVKDIYQVFINKNATERQLVKQSRWSSVILVTLGLVLTFNLKSINEIYGWITMSIGAGLIVPLLFRWYWWRLNGWGFAAGIAAGMITAIIEQLAAPNSTEYFSFLLVCGVSFAGMTIVTFATKPTDEIVLRNFYKTTRPFGFWRNVKSTLPISLQNQINNENRRDLIAIFFAVPWQLILFLSLMVLIMQRWEYLAYCFILLFLLSVGLYHFWFKHLSTEVNMDE